MTTILYFHKAISIFSHQSNSSHLQRLHANILSLFLKFLLVSLGLPSFVLSLSLPQFNTARVHLVVLRVLGPYTGVRGVVLNEYLASIFIQQKDSEDSESVCDILLHRKTLQPNSSIPTKPFQTTPTCLSLTHNPFKLFLPMYQMALNYFCTCLDYFL